MEIANRPIPQEAIDGLESVKATIELRVARGREIPELNSLIAKMKNGQELDDNEKLTVRIMITRAALEKSLHLKKCPPADKTPKKQNPLPTPEADKKTFEDIVDEAARAEYFECAIL
jgi:hypothetical protein